MKRVAFALVALLAGCNLYWGQNPPPVCTQAGGGASAPGAPAYETRDPYTGECTYVDPGGGGCGAVDSNGCCIPTPLNGAGTTSGIAQAVGASCSGACEGLPEASCTATPGCHAEYDYAPVAYPNGGTGTGSGSGNVPVSPLEFVACWDIQPLPVIEGGDCTQLDAYTCAEHDDCISIMSGYGYGSGIGGGGTGGGSAMPLNGGALAGSETFVSCAPEAQTTPDCSTVNCGSGATCEIQCYGSGGPPNGDSTGTMSGCSAVCVPTNDCSTIDCGPNATCGVSCDAAGNCAPQCYPNNPNDPGSCTGTISCGQPSPICPSDSTPGILNGCYSGYCIPKSKCTIGDPGSCDASGVHCNIAPPSCPAGTVPGVSNGCWSGFCIPQADCPLPDCATLTTAAACTARTDCTAVYTGTNCTCTSSGSCTCQNETFARCELQPVVDPPVPVNGGV